MIDEIQFSAKGARNTTAFEQRLLATVQGDSVWGVIAGRLVKELGPQIAADVMAILLDEAGGGKVYVPHRKQFFERLWREERDALICAMAARPDWSYADIARSFGINRGRVRSIVLRG
ncbi:hypothetical protein DYQ93_11385 [Xanthomonas sp. LMG 8992]|uniref:hypothetical protein n=1 Tax=Xanthomonas sp. LMG 8992 TaxID=1591157 RepID=UPI0013702365|nr:hypothetical protein [Xanthomonas sp. LMG 8992]MXV11622.1 hypothetical protein [Xanthomonas sp. LMG 8992]